MGELRECFLCGRNGRGDRLERHHIFGAAHRNAETAAYLHRCGERKALEQGMTREEFKKLFGKDYL